MWVNRRILTGDVTGLFLLNAVHWQQHDRAMTQTIVHLVAGIQTITLIVFYTEAHCWQFRGISSGGAVFGERKLYYTPEAAEKAGRDWIKQGR